MNNMTFILILGVASIAMRVIPGLVMRNVKLSPQVYRSMSFVPLTIFTAMVASDIFYWKSAFSLDPLLNIKIIPSILAAITAYYTKDIIKTIIVGVLSLSLLFYFM